MILPFVPIGKEDRHADLREGLLSGSWKVCALWKVLSLLKHF